MGNWLNQVLMEYVHHTKVYVCVHLCVCTYTNGKYEPNGDKCSNLCLILFTCIYITLHCRHVDICEWYHLSLVV